ncbi:hypothetical protein BP6252_12085 [Coleophoma cylindrospora]|uniref:Uncharacterized protein n=1 Tax=Coleophoma cylindrospora TaxID=1849047 RepID=A0A3D8QFU8_9HELO|nr:hypothetical protein BP6252_12085 [Coleophoma cylindrospora]
MTPHNPPFRVHLTHFLGLLTNCYNLCHHIRQNRRLGRTHNALDNLQQVLFASINKLQDQFNSLHQQYQAHLDLGDERAKRVLLSKYNDLEGVAARLDAIAFKYERLGRHGDGKRRVETPGFREMGRRCEIAVREVAIDVGELARRLEKSAKVPRQSQPQLNPQAQKTPQSGVNTSHPLRPQPQQIHISPAYQVRYQPQRNPIPLPKPEARTATPLQNSFKHAHRVSQPDIPTVPPPQPSSKQKHKQTSPTPQPPNLPKPIRSSKNASSAQPSDHQASKTLPVSPPHPRKASPPLSPQTLDNLFTHARSSWIAERDPEGDVIYRNVLDLRDCRWERPDGGFVRDAGQEGDVRRIRGRSWERRRKDE